MDEESMPLEFIDIIEMKLEPYIDSGPDEDRLAPTESDKENDDINVKEKLKVKQEHIEVKQENLSEDENEDSRGLVEMKEEYTNSELKPFEFIDVSEMTLEHDADSGPDEDPLAPRNSDNEEDSIDVKEEFKVKQEYIEVKQDNLSEDENEERRHLLEVKEECTNLDVSDGVVAVDDVLMEQVRDLDKVVRGVRRRGGEEERDYSTYHLQLNLETKRKPSKKHWCKICTKLVTNFMRHLVTMHRLNEVAVEYHRHKTEKAKKSFCIRTMTEWDAEYNLENPLNKIERKRSLNGVKRERVSCHKCLSVVSKEHFIKHFKKYHSSPNSKCISAREIRKEFRIESVRNVPCLGPEMANSILPSMRDGPIKDLIKNDSHIILYGNKLCLKYKGEGQDNLIRQNLRLIGKMSQRMISLDCDKEKVKCAADIFHPKKYDIFVTAIKDLCGAGKGEGGEYRAPTAPQQYGPKLRNFSNYVYMEAMKREDEKTVLNVKRWQEIYDSKYDKMVASLGFKQGQRRDFGTKDKVALMEDVQKVLSFLKEELEKAHNDLSDGFKSASYDTLSKCLLMKIWTFNRQRVGEVNKIRLKDWNEATEVDEKSVEFQALTNSEQLCSLHFKHLLVRGKLRRTVGLLIAKNDVPKIELMVQMRREAGVAPDNKYLFAKTNNCYEGTSIMREFAQKCGVQDWKSLTGPRLRRQLATSLRYLDLSEEVLRLVSLTLGHTLQTRLTRYSKRDAALRTGRVSKLFMAMDRGTLHQYKGHSLDQIDDETPSEHDSEKEENLFGSEEEEEACEDLSLLELLPGPSSTTSPAAAASSRPSTSFHKSPNPIDNWSPPPLESHDDYMQRENTPGRKRKFSKRCSRGRTRWTSESKNFVYTLFKEFIEDKRCPSLGSIKSKMHLIEVKFPQLSGKSPQLIKTMLNNLIRKNQ